MLLRSPIAGALALALLPLAETQAREPLHARIECVGLYCAIVPEPAPRPVANRRPAFALRASADRPRAWCGWWMRQQVGRDPGIAFNLARNWAHWGRPARPGPGVVAVWPHHVGLITGRAASGLWIVRSGNDGNAMRERPMSLARAIAFRTE